MAVSICLEGKLMKKNEDWDILYPRFVCIKVGKRKCRYVRLLRKELSSIFAKNNK